MLVCVCRSSCLLILVTHIVSFFVLLNEMTTLKTGRVRKHLSGFCLFIVFVFKVLMLLLLLLVFSFVLHSILLWAEHEALIVQILTCFLYKALIVQMVALRSFDSADGSFTKL